MPTGPTTDQIQPEEDNPDGGGPNCFSGTNIVEVRGKGAIAMENLEIGDYVKARNGIYSKVYSLGHFDPNEAATFLAITVKRSTGTSVLEITADHIVFVQSHHPSGKVTASTAADVKVGDVLISSEGSDESSSNDASNKVVVQTIDTIQRRGLYAPVTNDGTVQVSGVLASSYVVLFDHHGVLSPDLQHTVFHSLCAGPIRILCAISFETFCGNESHDANGISEHFSELIALGKLLVRNKNNYSSPVVQSAVFFFKNDLLTTAAVVVMGRGWWLLVLVGTCCWLAVLLVRGCRRLQDDDDDATVERTPLLLLRSS